jgi:hypothetical protein
VLYDVSTLYFETDAGDGFREPGFSKERRLEPQITIGLLTGQDGFPLMVSAFEGNRAETKTMLPVIEKFMAAHNLPDVTVVADAGMISEANQKAIEATGLSFILGMKIPHVPYAVEEWRRQHPGEDIPDGQVFTQPWRPGPPPGGVTRRSTTSTGPAGPGGRCAGSTSRSPRPPRPSPGWPRSSGTGSSPSTARSKASTASWRPRPGTWPG